MARETERSEAGATRRRGAAHGAALLALLAILSLPACQTTGARARSDATKAAPVNLLSDEWQGRAIAYSGYRRGQSPATGELPSRRQVEEDLRILAKNWRLIRVYKADRHARDVLRVIRREKLDLKVMLGLWLDREPGAEKRNAEQIEDGIRLANRYDDIVVAVNVGNEVLVEWTEHPVPEEQMIRYVRRVKQGVSQPVTIADNYVWWRDEGAALAREVDFIAIHTYPIYERRDIEDGLSYTIENYEGVREAHPDKPIVITEAGWATYTDSNLNVPRAGDEAKQRRYYEELMAWSRENGVTVFFFEAFDEPWKGTGTEGHWGVFTVDREAKPVMQGLYPELEPAGPTSPEYPDVLAPLGPALSVALRASLADTIEEGSVNPLGPGLERYEVVEADGADGGTALRLVFTGEAWAGVYFILGEHDASAAGSLALRMKLTGDVAGLELKLEGPADRDGSVELLEFAGAADAHGWRTFTVPLTAFDGVDVARLVRLGLWNPRDRSGGFAPSELLLDDIRFE